MNYVIIAILVVMIAIGIVYTKKHFSVKAAAAAAVDTR